MYNSHGSSSQHCGWYLSGALSETLYNLSERKEIPPPAPIPPSLVGSCGTTLYHAAQLLIYRLRKTKGEPLCTQRLTYRVMDITTMSLWWTRSPASLIYMPLYKNSPLLVGITQESQCTFSKVYKVNVTPVTWVPWSFLNTFPGSPKVYGMDHDIVAYVLPVILTTPVGQKGWNNIKLVPWTTLSLWTSTNLARTFQGRMALWRQQHLLQVLHRMWIRKLKWKISACTSTHNKNHMLLLICPGGLQNSIICIIGL